MHRFTSLIVAIITTSIMTTCLWASPDSFGGRKMKEDPYEKQLLQQIERIAVTENQLDAFRANMRHYYKERNGATRRISRQGGDLAIKVARELRRCARNSNKTMAKVLTEDQLAEYDKFLALANEQYLVNASLIK